MPNKTPKVLVSTMFEPHSLDTLRERFPQVRFVHLPKEPTLPDEALDAEIFLRLGLGKQELSDLLQQAQQIQWIHTSTAGFDWVMVPEVLEREIVVTRSAAAKANPIAEYVVAYIFLMAKRFPELARAQAAHQWTSPDTDEVRGRTVGVVGAGAIGCEVARLCTGLGMKVIGTKRDALPLPYFDAVLPPQELPALLGQSDYVVLTTPLTPETAGMIGEAQLRMMKPSAFLLNVARGGLLDEAALIRALQEGWIAGACLDTVVEEPLPADSPLWETEGLFITPHASWGSPRSMEYVLDEFIVNLERYLAGDELLNRPRNLALGY
jgi:phosphoglycerate dehydrogenase-like enzyme